MAGDCATGTTLRQRGALSKIQVAAAEQFAARLLPALYASETMARIRWKRSAQLSTSREYEPHAASDGTSLLSQTYSPVRKRSLKLTEQPAFL
jgi:hypothetical protein